MADNNSNRGIDETRRTDNEPSGFLYGYVTVIDRYPVYIVLLIATITIGCGIIAFMTSGSPFPDDPRLGFELRNTEISDRYLSFINFINADTDVLSPVPRGNLLSRREAVIVIDGPGDAKRTKRQEQPQCPPPDGLQPAIVFVPSEEETSLLDADHLISICAQEERLIRAHPSFLDRCSMMTNQNGSSTCCPSWSLGYVVALLNNKSLCSDITQEDVNAANGILRNCAPFYTSGALANNNAIRTTEIPPQCAQGNLVFTIFNFLVPNALHEDIGNGRGSLTFTLSFSPIDCIDSSESCMFIYDDNLRDIDALNDGTTKVVAMDFKLKIPLFDELLISDFRFIALGVVVAGLIIWIYTGSLLITIGSLLNMGFSITLAFFFYHMVFRIPYFLFPNFSAMILVIGIGADDTFVYVDLWKSSKHKFNGEMRRIDALYETTRHAMLTLFVTTVTTSTALYTTASTKIIAAKCFAIFGGTALAGNFIYTVTWLPAIIVLHDRYFDLDNSGAGMQGSSPPLKTFLMSLGKMFNKVRHSTLLSGFFENVLPTIIYYLRYVWIALFLLFGISGAIFTFVYPRLELAEAGELQLLKETHPFESFDQVYRNNLDYIRSTSQPFPLIFIWGALPSRNPNLWDPNDFGLLELDTGFQFSDAISQQWLHDFCIDLKQQWFYGNKTSFCFIDSFKEWMRRPCYTAADSPCCGQTAFPFAEQTFIQCSGAYALSYCQREPCGASTPGLRFNQNGSINALYLYFDSSVPYSTQFAPTDEFWTALSSWTEDRQVDAPEGLSGGWCFSVHDIQLGHYDIQSGIPQSTLFTICIALASACVILLLTTRDLYITIFATVTISFTVISTIGSLVWLGWELNVFEAIAFTLAVGLSVDFTIHFGVAYGLAPDEGRKARAIFVVKTLGSAITAAALSTFAAGAAMVFAQVITYFQIAVFLMVVMVTSWLFAFFFFLPLCITFGPDGNQGQLLNIFSRCCTKT